MSTTLEQMQEAYQELIFNSYTRYPVTAERALGSRIWDADGKEYIDLLAGIAVTSLGHSHPEVAETIAAQSRKLVHVSNLLYQQGQIDLARALKSTAHFGKVFFCNSGAEANEAAVKLARRYQQRIRNTDAYEVITFEGAFHGRTLAMLGATGGKALQDGFAPIPEGFRHIPWGDPAALEAAISGKTAAVLLEMVQGESGVRPVTQAFATAVQDICRKRGVLFIADEVQCGMGRTGKWWGFQHFGLTPDIMSTAKALANGLPMGAMMATDEIARAFVPGSHATTFGGSALLCAAAVKTHEIIVRDKLMENAASMGAWALERFAQIRAKFPSAIADVRGLGLMIGVELASGGKEIWAALLDKGFIVNLSHERTLRLLPALNVDKGELEAFAAALEDILAVRA